MDDAQIIELLAQIQELAGLGLDALAGGGGAPAGEMPPEGDEMPPEGEMPPPA